MIKLRGDTVQSAPDQLDDREVKAVREWVNTKRQVSVKEVGGNLSISSEVGAEFQVTNERVNGIRQRAPGGATDVFARGMDIVYKLMFDYRTDHSWLAMKLKFKNKAGLFKGTDDKIRLEKAFWGLRVCEQDTMTFDVEMGRRNLSTVFDSKLQFNSLFDGILIKYDKGFEKVGNFYIHGGGFVVDQTKDHYSYVGEIGLLDVLNTGLYTKFSVIDWDTKHTNYSRLEQKKFDFLISQLTLGYEFTPKCFDKPFKFYAGLLYNWQAKRREMTDYKKEPWAGYVGCLIGRTRKKGDWAFEVSGQWMEAQSVPDFDVCGVGIGNAANTGFYFNKDEVPNTRKTAAGNVNWYGSSLSLSYLLTDNLNIKQQFQISNTLDKHIGPKRRYKQYEIDFIYAF